MPITQNISGPTNIVKNQQLLETFCWNSRKIQEWRLLPRPEPSLMNPEGGSCLLGSNTLSFYHCTGVLEAARDRFDLVTVHSLPRVSPNQFWRVQSWNDHQVFFSSPFIVYITWIESAKSSRSVHRSLLIPSWQDRYVFRQYFTFFILGTSFTQQLWTIFECLLPTVFFFRYKLWSS